MADIVKNIKLGYIIDQAGLKGLDPLKKSLSDIARMSHISTGDYLEKDLKKASNAARQLEASLAKSINQDLGKINVEALIKDLKSAGYSLDRLQKDLALSPYGAETFSQLENSMTLFGESTKHTHKLLNSMWETLGNTLKWNIASTAINAISGSLQTSFYYVKDLDESLTNIRIVTGQSQEQMESFAVSANKAAKALGNSTLEYTDAALIYYQQGKATEEVNKLAEVTVKASNVTGASAQETSDLLTAVWNGYQISASKAESSVDKMAAVAAGTASDLEELSIGMSKVASAANLMGVDFDQLNAMLATVTSVTKESPETIGTSFKTIFSRMTNLKMGETDEDGMDFGAVAADLNKLGISITDEAGNLRDMGIVMQETGDKWKTFSREQQVALAQSMAGTRQYSRLLALFENWDMYSAALKTSQEALGTLDEQNKIYMESIEAKSKELQTSLEALWSKVIDIEVLKEGTDLLSGFVSVVDLLIESFGGLPGVLVVVGSLFTRIFNKKLAQNAVDTAERLKTTFGQIGKEARKLELGGLEKIQGNTQLLNYVGDLKKNWSELNSEQKDSHQVRIQTIEDLQKEAIAIDKAKKEQEEYLRISREADEAAKKGKAIRKTEFNAYATEYGVPLLEKSDSNEIEAAALHGAMSDKYYTLDDEITRVKNSLRLTKFEAEGTDQAFSAWLNTSEEEAVVLRNILMSMGNVDIDTVDAQFSIDALQQKIESLDKELQKVGKDMAHIGVYAGHMGNTKEFEAEVGRLSYQKIRNKEVLADEVKKAQELLETQTKVANMSRKIEGLSTITSLTMEFQGLFNVWNSGASTTEKITSSLIGMGSQLTMIGMSAVQSGLSIGAYLKSFIGIINPWTAGIAAAGVALYGLVKLYDHFNVTMKETVEIADKAAQKYDSEKKKLDELKTSYDGLETSIAAIRRGEGNEEGKTLAILESQLSIMKDKVALQEEVTKLAAKEASDKAKAVLQKTDKKYYISKTGSKQVTEKDIEVEMMLRSTAGSGYITAEKAKEYQEIAEAGGLLSEAQQQELNIRKAIIEELGGQEIIEANILAETKDRVNKYNEALAIVKELSDKKNQGQPFDTDKLSKNKAILGDTYTEMLENVEVLSAQSANMIDGDPVKVEVEKIIKSIADAAEEQEKLRLINLGATEAQALENIEFNKSTEAMNKLSNAYDANNSVAQDYITVANSISQKTGVTTEELNSLIDKYPELAKQVSYMNGMWYFEDAALGTVTGGVTDLQNAYLAGQDAMNKMLTTSVQARLNLLGIEAGQITGLANAYQMIAQNESRAQADWATQNRTKANLGQKRITFEEYKAQNPQVQQTNDFIKLAGTMAETKTQLEQLGKATKQYKGAADDAAKATDKMQKELDELNKTFEDYQSAHTAVIDLLDDEIEKLQEAVDLEKERLSLQKEQYDSVLDAVQLVYDREIERLEEQKASIEENYNLQMKAIQDEIDAKQDALDISQAAYDLEQKQLTVEKLKNQKTKLVFDSEQGMIYTRDEAALKEAENALAEEKYNAEIDALNTLKENLNTAMEDEIKILDESIEKLNEYKKAWDDVSTNYTNQQAIMMANATLGADWEEDVLSGRSEKLGEFLTTYNTIQAQLNDIEDEKTANQLRIKELEDYKKKWEEIATAYESQQNKIKAATILGTGWETDVLSGSITTLTNFRNNYISLQDEIKNKAEAVASAMETAATKTVGAINTINNAPEVKTPEKKYYIEDQYGNRFVNTAFKDQKTAIEYMVANSESLMKKVFDLNSAAKTFGLKKDLLDVNSLSAFKPAGYVDGVKELTEQQLAWTQEMGREMIVSPTRNSILTPLAPGDSVLKNKFTDTIFDFVENPKKFILNNIPSIPNLDNLTPQGNTQKSFTFTGDIVLQGVQDVDQFGRALKLNINNVIKQNF